MDEPFLFCPHCGGKLMLENIKASEPERHVCEACRTIHFRGPKLAAGVMLLHDGQIVLGRRDIEPGKGLWTYPGGFVERGEPVPDAAKREAREEFNVEVELERLLGVYSYPNSIIAIVIYLGHTKECKPTAGDEIQEIKFYAPHEGGIPWEDLAFRSVNDSLNDFLKSRR